MLSILFGVDFDAAYEILLILSGARLIDVGAGPVASLLAMTGGQSVLARVLAGATIANIVGGLLLIPPLGMIGAAITTATVWATSKVVLVVLTRRHAGINSSILG